MYNINCMNNVNFSFLFPHVKLTKELRAKGVKSMIVGVTSRTAVADKAAFIAVGLDECLEEPLTVEKIESLVETLVKNK